MQSAYIQINGDLIETIIPTYSLVNCPDSQLWNKVQMRLSYPKHTTCFSSAKVQIFSKPTNFSIVFFGKGV